MALAFKISSHLSNYDNKYNLYLLMKRKSVFIFVAISALSLFILCHLFSRERKRGKGRVMATKKFTELRFIIPFLQFFHPYNYSFSHIIFRLLFFLLIYLLYSSFSNLTSLFAISLFLYHRHYLMLFLYFSFVFFSLYYLISLFLPLPLSSLFLPLQLALLFLSLCFSLPVSPSISLSISLCVLFCFKSCYLSISESSNCNGHLYQEYSTKLFFSF